MIHIYDLFKLNIFFLKKKTEANTRKEGEKKQQADSRCCRFKRTQIHAAQINKKGDRRSQDEDRMTKQEKSERERNKRAHTTNDGNKNCSVLNLTICFPYSSF